MPWTKLGLPTEDEMRRMDAEYRGRVRFLVDESMGEQVAQILRSEGFNVRYAGDVGLIGRSDEDVFAEAWRDNRVIITHDPDFLDNSRFPPHRNPGVVLIRPGSSGRDNRGLQVCLIKTTLIAADHATWYRGKKLDYSSEEMLTIISGDGRRQIRWARNSDPMIWED
jgi:predicted nuclease of predicted toxin-antitoxin system